MALARIVCQLIDRIVLYMYPARAKLVRKPKCAPKHVKLTKLRVSLREASTGGKVELYEFAAEE